MTKLMDYLSGTHIFKHGKDVEKWLFGRDPKLKQVPTGNAQQENFMEDFINQLMNSQQGGGSYGQAQEGFGKAQDYLSGLLGPGGFEEFSKPYNQQFEQQIMPRIAEKFAGYGNSSGALSSSGFAQALSGGASDFQSKLAQLFSQLQQGAAGQLSNNYANAQNSFNQQAQLAQNYQPFAYYQDPGKQGHFAEMLAMATKAAAGGV